MKLGTKSEFARRYSSEWHLSVVAKDIDRIEANIETLSAPTRRLKNLIRKMFTGAKEIEFSASNIEITTKSGKNLPLGALSSGEKHVLRIFMEALLTDVGTFLIDEPEISLHVKWQNQLVESLNLLNPDSQLIMATHSPEIMAELDDSKIFKL